MSGQFLVADCVKALPPPPRGTGLSLVNVMCTLEQKEDNNCNDGGGFLV